MRTKSLRAVFALLAWLIPAGAGADLLVTPYAGVNFGGSTIDTRAAFGASLTWLASSGVGAELDCGVIPDFFAPRAVDADVLGDNHVTTVMANVVFERPMRGMRPFVSAGAGLLRSQVADVGELFDAVDRALGVNAGGGVRVGSGRWSVRADLRYFRAVTEVDEVVLADVLTDFGFWRGTAGLSFGF